MNEIIGQPAEKHVSYYLSSNDMIGNPFSFSSSIVIFFCCFNLLSFSVLLKYFSYSKSQIQNSDSFIFPFFIIFRNMSFFSLLK